MWKVTSMFEFAEKLKFNVCQVVRLLVDMYALANVIPPELMSEKVGEDQGFELVNLACTDRLHEPEQKMIGGLSISMVDWRS
jgi:hypothetical protein